MYHVPLAFQCIYGLSNEGGEDGDGKDLKSLLRKETRANRRMKYQLMIRSTGMTRHQHSGHFWNIYIYIYIYISLCVFVRILIHYYKYILLNIRKKTKT